MSLNLTDQLQALFTAYRDIDRADPAILDQSETILSHSDREGELTLEEWEVIRRAFGVVAATSDQTFQDWFLAISRRFGTATHAVNHVVPRRNGGGKIDPTQTFAEQGVDLLRYGVLLLAFDLPSGLSPLDEGLRRYLALPPDLRTYFTDEMLVMEQVLGGILAISPDKATHTVRQAINNREVERFLRRAYVDLRDLLFEHDTSWLMLYNSMRDRLWESDRPVHVFRAHINMTSLNEKDSSGHHGDILLAVVRGWLKEHFPGAVQNPERTSFSFVAASAARVRAQLTDFANDMSTRLFNTLGSDPEVLDSFTPEIMVSERVITRGNLYAYAIQTPDDLDAFTPVIEFGGDLKVAALKEMGIKKAREKLLGREPPFEAIRQSRNFVLIKTLDALVLKALVGMNGLLAAQTSFFERQRPNLDSFLGPDEELAHRSVYEESDLPSAKKPLYDRWCDTQLRLSGYVGPGQYQPAENPQLAGREGPSIPPFQLGKVDMPGLHLTDDPALHPRVNRLLRAIPRLERTKGSLSHARAGSRGGLIEQFMASVRRLAALSSNTPAVVVAEQLRELQEVTRQLREGFRAFYSRAITDPRHAWTPKQHRVFKIKRGDSQQEVDSDFFLQEVALSGNRNLAVLEYDSFNAYQSLYPPYDEVDTDFNRVRDALFIAARRMNMADPLVKPSGGDHISISFSERDLEGNEIDPIAYCALVQKLVKETFQGRPFQDYHKVEMHQLDLLLIGEEADSFGPDGLIRALMNHFHFNAEPIVRRVSGSNLVLYTPTKNNVGKKVSAQEVHDYLGEIFLQTEFRRDSSVEIKRLPMWQKSGVDPEKSDFWVFGSHQPEGYEPFMKTLTVSMALGVHKPVKTPEDAENFARTE